MDRLRMIHLVVEIALLMSREKNAAKLFVN
jgi:hypothetical protein